MLLDALNFFLCQLSVMYTTHVWRSIGFKGRASE